MSRASSPVAAYSDHPPLHSNLVLGTLHLAGWLLWRPSAWTNHLARVGCGRGDAAPAALSAAAWRSAGLRRLLIQGVVIWPLLVGALVGLGAYGFGAAPDDGLYNAVFGITTMVCLSLVVGVGVGMAFGLALLLTGLVSAVSLALLGTFLAEHTPVASATLLTITIGLTLGMTGSIAGMIAAGRPTTTVGRHLSGIVIGVLLGVGTGSLAVLLSRRVSAPDFALGADPFSVTVDPIGRVSSYLLAGLVVCAPLALTIALAAGLGGGRWRRGVFAGGLMAVLYALIILALSRGDRFATMAAYGLGIAVFFSALFGLPYVIARRIGGAGSAAIAGAIGGGGVLLVFALFLPDYNPLLNLLAGAAAIAVGLTLSWWRPLLTYPFQVVFSELLHRWDERRASHRPALLRWHAACWDELQYLPLTGLVEHLVLVVTRNPSEGQAALAYLNGGRQRWAARQARLELDVRTLEQCTDIATMAETHRRLALGDLDAPTSVILRGFSQTSQDLEVALRQQSSYRQRLALRGVEGRLNRLQHDLILVPASLSMRFQPVVTQWRLQVERYHQELQAVAEQHQEIESPYVVGMPLTEEEALFVGRLDISAQIEQLLLDRRCPPLLVYGQRRMGKTSLLNNLGRLLPSTIVPLFVDLQRATSAESHAGLLYNIARSMRSAAAERRGLPLPPLTREMLADDPFTMFDDWLDAVELALGPRTALLALDEFERLDGALLAGRFDAMATLGLLRSLIQHRRCFRVLLAGSYTLRSLHHRADYLINVQALKLGYLTEAEARQLIERPIWDFPLRYEALASQRVLELTRGHPGLVQLLCNEVISFKNTRPLAERRLIRTADVEAAAAFALNHGAFFFAEIEVNQVSRAGLALLRWMAAQGEGAVIPATALHRACPEASDSVLQHLLEYDLIEQTATGYRFQIELVRRWFARAVVASDAT